MKRIDQLVRALAQVGIALAAIALLASMFLIGYSVVMRYFLNQPAAWVDELCGYLLVAAVMLAAADALLQGEHLAVDLLTERLAARGRRWTVLAGWSPSPFPRCCSPSRAPTWCGSRAWWD